MYVCMYARLHMYANTSFLICACDHACTHKQHIYLPLYEEMVIILVDTKRLKLFDPQ